MRRGFSLLTAIVFVVLIATIGALALSFSSLNTKQTSDIYLREQAEILLQSATEYALLAISGHDVTAAGNCLNNIDLITNTEAGFRMFDINMSLHYIGNNNLPAGCNRFSANNIATNDSNVTVIIDTIITSFNGPVALMRNMEPIRLHRRTIQKP